MKRCSRCREWKGEGEFGKRKKGSKDGLTSECKECHNAACLARYYANWEMAKAANLARYYANWEMAKAANLARYYANSEKILAAMRARRQADNEKYIALAGGVCQKCGKLYDWPAMEFHHIDPAQKKKEPWKAIRQYDDAELDKCVLLCAICHATHESQLWQARWRKRDGLGYELVEWWFTRFSDLGQTSDDPRWRKNGKH